MLGHVIARKGEYELVERVIESVWFDLYRDTHTIIVKREGVERKVKVPRKEIVVFSEPDIDAIFGECLLIRR